MAESERNVEGCGRIISYIDHGIACANVIGTTFDNYDTLINLSAIEAEQIKMDRDAYTQLAAVGRHLIPLDHNGEISSDTSNHAVYLLAMRMALATLDALCERFKIDINSFRKVWKTAGFVKVLDVNSDAVRDFTPQEMYEEIASGIIAAGQRAMDEYGSVYDDLIDEMIHINALTASNPNMLRAAYGYVMSGGVNALGRLIEEREIHQLTKGIDINQELEAILQQPVATDDRTHHTQPINHELIANDFDTEVFYASQSVESYLGQLVEAQMDEDGRPVELLIELAALMYSSELGNFALDETGEAFFMGAILALETTTRIAGIKGIEGHALKQAWRNQHAHKKLEGMTDIPERRSQGMDSYVKEVLGSMSGYPDYATLIDKITDTMDYDLNESSAFQNGFDYMMITGARAIASITKAAISHEAKSAMKDIDEEIKALLGE